MSFTNFSDGNPSFDSGRKTMSPLAAILMLVLIAAFGLFMGISGFFKTEMSLDDALTAGPKPGKYVSGVPAYGANHPNFEYSHKISVLPLINENYYLVLSDDMQHGVLVRADEEFGKNFSSEDYSNITGIKIKGNVKSTSTKVQNNFSGMDYRSVHSSYYIDLLSTKMNIYWLIIGIYNVIALVCVIIHFKKNGVGSAPSTVLGKVFAGVMLIGAFYITYLLLVMIVQLV